MFSILWRSSIEFQILFGPRYLYDVSFQFCSDSCAIPSQIPGGGGSTAEARAKDVRGEQGGALHRADEVSPNQSGVQCKAIHACLHMYIMHMNIPSS